MHNRRRFSSPALAALIAVLIPAAAAAQSFVTGSLGGDLFGASVRGVGDLNNDGFEDFAVGAPGNDANGSNAGAVYIYFGRAQNAPTTPDLTLTAGDGGDQFGFSVAGIGRFNNDAFDDIAVGAPYSDNGGTGRGLVYVFYGGNPMNTTPDVTLGGQQGGDHFGWSVDGGFDFNNDGRADLIVGAPDRTANGLQSGEARIFLGASNPSTTAAHVFLGDQPRDQFGFSVRRGGHVNGDNYDDVVVGAPQQFEANSGRAYVIFGAPSGTPVRTTLTGEFGTDRFGWSVAGGGDVNNDGFDDIAVGAPKNDFNNLDNGAVYLFLGGSVFNAVSDAKVGGRSSGDRLGTSVSITGDYDKDGRADLLAGAPLSDAGAARTGEANLWKGAAPLGISREVFPISRPAPSFAADDEFGADVDFVDFNGDGNFEVLAGAPAGNRANGDATGFAMLAFFPGTLVPVTLADLAIVPAGDRVRLSWRVTEAEEVSGFHVERRGGGTDWERLTAHPLDGDARGAFAFEDTGDLLAAGGVFEYRLVVLARDGSTDLFGPFSVTVAPSVAPLLGQNYPNPTQLPTAIVVNTPRGGPATVTLFDARGRSIRTLFAGTLSAGTTVLSWDGRDDEGRPAPSGTYYYRLDAGTTRTSKKLVLTR